MCAHVVVKIAALNSRCPGFDVCVMTGMPSAVDREGTIARLVEVEILDRAAQLGRSFLGATREIVETESTDETSRAEERVDRVSLDLDQRDGPLDQSTIGKADAVRAVFPALVAQAAAVPDFVR